MKNPSDVLLERINAQNLWEESLVIDRKEYLVEAGVQDTRLFFVEEGSLRIYVIEAEEECTIRFGYKGSVIVAMDSFITELPTTFFIEAIKKSKVRAISKQRYMEFIQDNSENLELWNQLLSGLVYQQLERERDLLISSPAERYQRVLQRSPQLFQEIPARYIASYLRMTPETLSRLKKS